MVPTQILYLIFILHLQGSATDSPENSEDNVHGSTSNNNDIVFDTADIEDEYDIETGKAIIQAFQTKRTAELLKTGNALQENQQRSLRWVTPGLCRFQPNALEFRHQMVNAYIICHTDHIKQFLAEKATKSHGVQIQPDQILPLRFSKMLCITKFVDPQTEQNVVLTGQVHTFQTTPLKLQFEAPEKSDERAILQKVKQENITLDFQCKAYANGKVDKINKLNVDFNSADHSFFIEELLGNATSTFVTRAQMNEFVHNVYQNLRIEEVYEMPEKRFSETFLESFVDRTYHDEPISFALEHLSKYAIDFTADFAPDIIIRELSSIYSINDTGSESHIILDKKNLDKFFDKYQISSSQAVTGKASASFLGVSGSVKAIVNSNNNAASETNTEQQRSSLDDQLKRMNSHVLKDVIFEIEGRQVKPKMLNVAKVLRSKIARKMTFQRIYKEHYATQRIFRMDLTLNDYRHEAYRTELLRRQDQQSNDVNALKEENQNIRNLVSLGQSKPPQRVNLSMKLLALAEALDEALDETTSLLKREIENATSILRQELNSKVYVLACRICLSYSVLTTTTLAYACSNWVDDTTKFSELSSSGQVPNSNAYSMHLRYECRKHFYLNL